MFPIGLDIGFAFFFLDDSPRTADAAAHAAHAFEEVAVAVAGQDIVNHGFASRDAIGFAGLDVDLAVRIQLMDRFRDGFGDAAGIGIADARFRSVRQIIFRQGCQVDIGDGKEVAQFLIGQDVIDSTDQVRFFPFGFLSQAGSDEDGLGFGMKGFHRAAAGNHGRNRARHVRQELVIEFLDHGDPHGAAAAGELELIFAIDVLVKFQSFFQGQDIGKDSDFQHARKAQALESRPQFPHGNIGTELAGYGRGDHGVNRAVVIMQFLNDRDDVFPCLQGIELTSIDTGLAADALAVVDGNAVGTRRNGAPIAGFLAVMRFIRRTETGFDPPDQGMVIGMSQTVNQFRVAIDTDRFAFRSPLEHLLI